jgi:hypothetical protein
VRHTGRGNSSNCITLAIAEDASLFNCLVLCARCHQAEHADALTALPIRSETIDSETWSWPTAAESTCEPVGQHIRDRVVTLTGINGSAGGGYTVLRMR